jgi:hypothetical protein
MEEKPSDERAHLPTLFPVISSAMHREEESSTGARVFCRFKLSNGPTAAAF